MRWKSPRPLVFCSPRGQVRIPSGTYRCRAHSARLAARALGELEPSWTASRRRSPSRRSREDSASVAYERGGPGSSAPKAVSSPGRYTDRVERAISRATVFPFVFLHSHGHVGRTPAIPSPRRLGRSHGRPHSGVWRWHRFAFTKPRRRVTRDRAPNSSLHCNYLCSCLWGSGHQTRHREPPSM